MTYRTASAPARPASRTLAAIAATRRWLCQASGRRARLTAVRSVVGAAIAGLRSSQMPPLAAPQAEDRRPSRSRRRSSAAGTGRRRPAPPAASPGRRRPASPASRGRPKRPAAGAADLFALDQVLPQGPARTAADPNAKQVCFTGKDARIESGMPVVAAVLIEPEGEDEEDSARHVAARHAARPRHARHRRSEPADDGALRDLLHQWLHGRLRSQRRHDRQDEEGAGPGRSGDQLPPASRSVWCCRSTDFAKAYDGPPTDPKVFEEQQKKLQEELQRRADEARKKLESQQGGPTLAGQSAAGAGKTQ